MSPDQHPAFYCSSRLTLNVTRRAMALSGYCPSGRLFEAAACGAPILSDTWAGLEQFFTPDEEILVASSTGEAVQVLEVSDSELRTIARRARERTLHEHTGDRRALDLERILEGVHGGGRAQPIDEWARDDERRGSCVGDHSGSGRWDADTTAGVLEGAAARRQSA
jgi:spore maturation protein CgeB